MAADFETRRGANVDRASPRRRSHRKITSRCTRGQQNCFAERSRTSNNPVLHHQHVIRWSSCHSSRQNQAEATRRSGDPASGGARVRFSWRHISRARIRRKQKDHPDRSRRPRRSCCRRLHRLDQNATSQPNSSRAKSDCSCADRADSRSASSSASRFNFRCSGAGYSNSNGAIAASQRTPHRTRTRHHAIHYSRAPPGHQEANFHSRVEHRGQNSLGYDAAKANRGQE